MDIVWVQGNWPTLTVEQRRNKLLDLEAVCKEQDDEHQLEIRPVEYFCNGVYAREITMPKGATVVGEIHKYAQLNVLSKGKLFVATEEGIHTLEAPCTFISPAGTKRAGFILEDAVWTTFHATELTDGEKIRQEIIAPDYETLDKQLECKPCHS